MSVAASLQTVIVVFGPTGVFVGEPGSFTPARTFQPIASLCTHTWRIDGAAAHLHDTLEAGGASSSAAAVEGALLQSPSPLSSSTALASTADLLGVLKGKRVVTTVATDCSRAALELFVGNMFRVFGAANLREVVVVGKALASSFAYGHERTRVVDIGFEAVTCSFVVSGVTEGCSTSRTLGVRKFLRNHQIAGSNSGSGELQMDWAALEAAFLGDATDGTKRNDVSKAPLVRLLKQLPVESRKGGVPVLLTGDAVDQPAVYHRLTSLLQPLVAALEGGASQHHVTSPTTASSASSSSLILPASHSRPALAHFTGISLLASLCVHVCDTIVVTRADTSTPKGIEVVHSRCPGIHRPPPQGNAATGDGATAAA
jgi:hypothetical protein